MSDTRNNDVQTNSVADNAEETVKPEVVSVRRRFLKGGASLAPVVLTLASRPVLAWHCKSPSAWGSEIINPNTSLKNNAGHASYIDETWTISNWKNNTPRTGNGLEDDGVAGKPWNELKTACPGLSNDETKSLNKKGRYFFDYRKVTVAHLVSYVPGFVNPGFGAATLVKDISSNDVKTYALVAQLNYVVLKNVKFSNGIDDCLREGQLAQMATGTYMENGKAWDLHKVKEYLYNNWVDRP